MKQILIFLILLVLLTSCDYPIFVHYTVHNTTKDTITIRYSYWAEEFAKTGIDTTLNLLPNVSDTLFTFRSVGPRVYLPEDSLTLKYLKNILVTGTAIDLLPDISITKNWELVPTKRNVARFEFQIK